MKKYEKELLLRDICCRIPHGLKVEFNGKVYDAVGSFGERLIVILPFMSNWESQPVELCEPYLRPMSSMTEEEKEDYLSECDKDNLDTLSAPHYHGTDWLNKKMFDYRGLIPMDLALPAPEGMYN